MWTLVSCLPTNILDARRLKSKKREKTSLKDLECQRRERWGGCEWRSITTGKKRRRWGKKWTCVREIREEALWMLFDWWQIFPHTDEQPHERTSHYWCTPQTCLIHNHLQVLTWITKKSSFNLASLEEVYLVTDSVLKISSVNSRPHLCKLIENLEWEGTSRTHPLPSRRNALRWMLTTDKTAPWGVFWQNFTLCLRAKSSSCLSFSSCCKVRRDTDEKIFSFCRKRASGESGCCWHWRRFKDCV